MKIASVVGARPQFIKCAPVLREFIKVGTSVLIHTGQHYDDNMSGVFFRELEIPPPEHDLGVGSGSHGAQTGEMLKRVEEVLSKERPDVVLVFGDTNSTLAGALAASKMHIPVAHVEAGLRSFNRKLPEEVNRVLTDHLSDVLFCPTQTAVNNLNREGIKKGVQLVGDVQRDIMNKVMETAKRTSTIIDRLCLNGTNYYLATIHRPENTDDVGKLREIVNAFKILSRKHPVVWPIHPRTKSAIQQGRLLEVIPASLRLVDPVSYVDVVMLQRHAKVVITDSGGIQKEACWLRVPCVTIRTETEWVETVAAGWNVLVEAVTSRIIDRVFQARRPESLMVEEVFGEGSPTLKIVEAILELGRREERHR